MSDSFDLQRFVDAQATIYPRVVEERLRERGLIKEGAPILLKFVTQVAARFGLMVTQKLPRKLFQSSSPSAALR
jgi:hypothetical protein